MATRKKATPNRITSDDPSRRSLLAGATATVGGAFATNNVVAAILTPGTSLSAAEQSEPIITLYRQWDRARAEFLAALERLSTVEKAYFGARAGGLELAEHEAAVEAAQEHETATSDRNDAAACRVLSTPARTLLGIALKLRIAALEVHVEHRRGFKFEELPRAAAAIIACLHALENMVELPADQLRRG